MIGSTAPGHHLRRLVDVRSGERRQVMLLFALSLCVGMARSFITTASVTIFFERFDASVLPYTYLGSAAIVAASGYAYATMEGRLRFVRLLPATLAGLVVYLGLLRLSLSAAGATWPPFAVAVSNEVVWVLTGLVYWGLAGRLFDVRQAKRLYGLVGSGEVIAIVLAGASVPVLVPATGTAELVTASGVGIVLMLVLLTYILRVFAGALAAQEGPAHEREVAPQIASSGAGKRLRDPYLVLVVVFATLCQMTYYLVDAGYVTEANAHYPSGEALAGFLGVFTAVTYAATFVTRVAVVAPLLGRFGVRVQSLITPISIGAGATAVVLLGHLAGPLGPLPLVFWLVCATKLMMEVNWDSIYGPAKLILLQPLPARLRLWSQTMVEGIAEPVAQGAAGVALLLYGLLVPFNGVTLASATVPVCLAFAVVAVLVGRRYVVVLRTAVTKRYLEETSLSFTDPETRSILERGLDDERPIQVLYCIEKLEEIADPQLGRFLSRLVSHPAAQVREDAFGRIERLRLMECVGVVAARLDVEHDARVRAAAIRAFCALDPAARDRVTPLLDDADASVRIGALVGLLRYESAGKRTEAEAALWRLANSPAAEERVLAAEAAAQLTPALSGGVLDTLLRDPDVGVRRSALVAVGQPGAAAHWPAILESLGDLTTSGAARTATLGIGRALLPSLRASLSQEGISLDLRSKLLTLCGRLGGPDAVNVLVQQMHYPHAEIRTQALRALHACAHRASREEAAVLEQLLEQEASIAAWALAARQALAAGGGVPRPMLDALQTEAHQTQERMFLMMGVRHERAAVTRARERFESGAREERANAVELLDNMLTQREKQFMLPMLEELDAAERLRRLRRTLPPREEPRTRDEWLIDVLAQPPQWITPWTRACALWVMGQLGAMTFLESAVAALRSPEPLIRETAIWTLGELQPDDLSHTLDTLTTDTAQHVATMAREVLTKCS